MGTSVGHKGETSVNHSGYLPFFVSNVWYISIFCFFVHLLSFWWYILFMMISKWQKKLTHWHTQKLDTSWWCTLSCFDLLWRDRSDFTLINVTVLLQMCSYAVLQDESWQRLTNACLTNWWKRLQVSLLPFGSWWLRFFGISSQRRGVKLGWTCWILRIKGLIGVVPDPSWSKGISVPFFTLSYWVHCTMPCVDSSMFQRCATLICVCRSEFRRLAVEFSKHMDPGLDKESVEFMRGSFYSGVNDTWLGGGPNSKGPLPAARALKANRAQQEKMRAAAAAKMQLSEDLQKRESASNRPDQERQVIFSIVRARLAEMDDPSEILESAWQKVHNMLSQMRESNDVEASCSWFVDIIVH